VTERLYYRDPDLVRFEARLVSQERLEGAGPARWAAVLDTTAFYPEGGGQPADQGTLGGVPVQDVQDREGEVLHLLAAPLAVAPGAVVSGELNAGRRADFRRQHTGQHVLSAALLTAAGARTVSANLGEELTSVELDAPALSVDAIGAAEDLANRIVNANHPVLVHWVSPEEAARFPLRKPPPPGRDRLRIVEIPGVDASACGGLHVASTGEVGLIRCAGQERIRGRVRLLWKIGERAWRDLRERDGMLAELARELTCGLQDLPASVRSLKARLKSQELAAARTDGRLAGLLAERLLAEAVETRPGGPRLVCDRLEGESPGVLPALFRALAAAPRTVVCLGSLPAPGAESGLSWVMGTSEDLDLPLGSLVPPLLALIDGKGGGRGHRWQGTARRVEGWPELCAALTRLLREATA